MTDVSHNLFQKKHLKENFLYTDNQLVTILISVGTPLND